MNVKQSNIKIKIKNKKILKNDKKNKRKTTLNGKLKKKVEKVDKVEEIVKKKNCKLEVCEVKEFKLVLVMVPNEWTEIFKNLNIRTNKIYILMSEEFKDISIGEKHNLTREIGGFNLDYPVYKLTYM